MLRSTSAAKGVLTERPQVRNSYLKTRQASKACWQSGSFCAKFVKSVQALLLKLQIPALSAVHFATFLQRVTGMASSTYDFWNTIEMRSVTTMLCGLCW